MESGSSAKIRVLIVDDHPMVREGLRSMLSADAIEVVGDAGTAVEAIRCAEELAPDVVLLDVELPDLDGVTALGRIKAVAPRASVLIVSMHDDHRLVRRAVSAGAAGYVLKGVGRRELLASVRAVRAGESVMDPALLRVLLAEIPPEPGARTPGGGGSESLTLVEREILRLIADGLTNKEIGERMRWSVGTAKKYVQRILEKLGVSDRTQAAVEAVRAGLFD
ncbi:MAG: response regulator transcription factor [Candidatus Rokubacteria bacterium]|nr:response regulator transcription factor [Candidatus Rokubacteria bacterium]